MGSSGRQENLDPFQKMVAAYWAGKKTPLSELKKTYITSPFGRGARRITAPKKAIEFSRGAETSPKTCTTSSSMTWSTRSSTGWKRRM